MLIIWKLPKRIAGRAKCPRGPHVASVFETVEAPSGERQIGD